jgi:hypothetical protein
LLPAGTEAQNAAGPGIPIPSHFTQPAQPLVPAPAALQRSGTVNITISATIGSNIPASQRIFCQAEIAAVDASFFNDALAVGTVTRSGRTGTCKISIPYIFEVSNAQTKLQVFAAIFTINSANTLQYDASFSFTPFAVPNGITNLKVNLAV